YEVRANLSGTIRSVIPAPGDAVEHGMALAFIEPGEVEGNAEGSEAAHDPSLIRPDLARVLERLAQVEDSARQEAVAKRHGRNLRTARENVADLCDPGSFLEFG